MPLHLNEIEDFDIFLNDQPRNRILGGNFGRNL